MGPGTADIYQDVSMQLADVGMLLACIVVPVLLPPHHKIVLVIKSDDISVSTIMGIKISGLKLEKSLTCSYLEKTSASPKPAFCGDQGASSANSIGVIMDCVYGAQQNLTS